MGSPLRYRAVVQAAPHDDASAIVRGRRVRFGANREYDKVSVQAVGRDGTVLLFRSSYGLYTTYQYSIVHGSVEVPVRAYGHRANVGEYRGAHDFAGSFYEDESQNGNSMMPPWVPPVAFVVEGGRHRKVGRGDVVAWEPGGTVATKLPVNAAGLPAQWEEENAEHVRVLEKGRTYDLGEVRYVGRQGAGFVFTDAEGSIFVWGKGRLRPWARLPKGCKAFATDGGSRLWAHGEEDEWRFGSLRGGVFRTLRFARPAKALTMSLAEPLSLLPSGSLRVAAYEGTEATRYEVTFAPVR